MAVVGINFGSATSGAGFDVTTTVASITANLKAIETPWNTQLTSLKAQGTALTTIGTDLSTLATSVFALTDFEGIMATKEGSSSNTDIVSLSSAGPTANAGSHTIVVNQLAQTSSQYTDAITASDTLSGSLTFQVGSGTPQTVDLTSGSSDTLKTYAAAINAADVGVTAAVISDTSGSRLSLVSKTGGAAGQLTITGSVTDSTTGNALNLHTGLTGQDAQVTVDGTAVDSASNTISTAIPGVTFQALSADPNTTVQIAIANDTTDVTTAFSTFVTSYNAVVKDLNTQEGTDSTGAAEPLYGQTIVSRLQSALSLALTTGTASGSISNLAQLGISVNNDGTLTLSSSTLTDTLNTSYSDVVGFLQNSGSFGQSLYASLGQIGSASPTGAITLQLANYTAQETTFNDNITAEDALIATDTTNITDELNLANEALQGIPEQLTEVNELYSSLTGYNQNSNG
jgi:flagellar hook-associated protein 2